jgi:hypothetical protein
MAPTSAATFGLLLPALFAFAPPPAAHAQSMGLPTSKHSGSIPAAPVAPPPASASITNGVLTVTVNAYGVVTNVTPNGWIPTFGPRVEIVPVPNAGTAAAGGAAGAQVSGIVEWYGLYFDLPSGPVAASASGLQADWTKRTPIERVAFTSGPDSAVAITRVGDLEIHTTFSFAPQSDHVVVSVELLNTGKFDVTDVLYTREWLTNDPRATSFPPEEAMEVPPTVAGVHRIILEANNLKPGMLDRTTFSLAPIGTKNLPAAVDVPLQRWTNTTWPNGLDFGATNGISFCDVDHDGFIDAFTCMGRQLWRDLGGTDWRRGGNVKTLIAASEFNYGSVLADYNNDQQLDIFTEPRGGCAHVLKNLGGRQFVEVGNDPNIVDVQPCNAADETNCAWDADGDGNLDVFFPTYPPSLGSTGNWFLQNLGPVGTGGEYTFHEDSAAAGLDNPPIVNRPEGAGIHDFDGDGDSDLYSNGTLYRNISVPGTPLFEPMTEVGTGIVHSDVLDEGAGFFDYDNDGDMDLCVAFCDGTLGVRMFEALGDGTYMFTKRGIFDSYNTGLCLGLSFDDWDNDGDIDVTTSEVFRRNQFVETGVRHFTLATHNINAADITDATPAWGDFDLDGDLDTALGNWASNGHLYENTLYDSSTPMDQRRYVRVKPVRDSASFDDGLETEYGAVITVHALGNSDDGLVRRKICAPSNGYLNQGEYTVHLALPPDPDPSDPDVDLDFEVTVDFKGASGAGFLRVDRHVNPVLGDLRLATLTNREISVYRSGRVRIDGADYLPAIPPLPLTTTTGGLLAPGVNSAIAPVVGAPSSDWFVGTEIATSGSSAPQRIEEVILDGQLDAAVTCGNATGNLFVWDVTTPANPVLVSDGVVDRSTKSRNDRSFLPIDVTLLPNRVYRVVARVTQLRATPIVGPVVDGAFTTNGGLTFQDTAPCSGAAVVGAAVDSLNVYLAVRFRDEPSSAWADLGHGLAGVSGIPALAGTGTLTGGSNVSLDVTLGAPNAPLFYVIGTSTNSFAFKGGVLVPTFDVIVNGLVTDGSGASSLSGTWPTGVAGGFTFYTQALIVDATAIHGLAFTNAIAGTAPY